MKNYNIKRLNFSEKHECDIELDCPSKTPCTQPLSYITNMELLIDDFNFSFGQNNYNYKHLCHGSKKLDRFRVC